MIDAKTGATGAKMCWIAAKTSATGSKIESIGGTMVGRATGSRIYATGARMFATAWKIAGIGAKTSATAERTGGIDATRVNGTVETRAKGRSGWGDGRRCFYPLAFDLSGKRLA